jgi:hypothetical protein
MGHQTPETTDEAPAAAAPDVQALIDQEVAAALAAHGITPAPAKPSALDRLDELAQDVEHSTFAERLEQLAGEGYQAVLDAEQSPVVKTLVTVLGELVAKVG